MTDYEYLFSMNLQAKLKENRYTRSVLHTASA